MKHHQGSCVLKLIAALALLGLSACTQLEQDVGECEPGVEGISGMATVAPHGTGTC